MTIPFTTFKTATGTVPTIHLVEWPDLPAALEALPADTLWSPFTFSGPRKKANTIETELFVADFDAASLADLLNMAHWCEARRLAHFWHTTKSHTEAKPKKRLVIRLDRTVSATEWKDVWQRMALLFPRIDQACKDSSRIYWPPAPGTAEASPCPSGDVWHWEHETAGRKAFDHVERKLTGKNDALAQALRNVLEGLPWSDKGSRDTTLYRMCCELSRHAPKTSVDALCEVFRASVNRLGDADLDWVHEKLERTREAVQDELAQESLKQEAAKQARLMGQLASCGRTELYSDNETERFTKELQYESMDHRWVVQYRDSYYVFCSDEKYHVRSSADVKSSLPADLAPAGLDLFNVSKSGKETLQPPHEVVARYGVVANGVEVSLTAKRSHFDIATRMFVEAPLPQPSFEPQYHAHIHEWLTTLTDDPHKLLSWIKWVTWLDRPCVALTLIGSKATGKSLLAQGLARLFGVSTPTKLASIYNSAGDIEWTQGLMKCPLLFADEALPQIGYSRNANTAALRELLQLRDLPLKRKFLPDATLRGCARVIVAANNDKIFANAGDNTPEDFAATAERFLVLNVGPEAAVVLARYDADVLETAWKGYEIAEHALWLRDNYVAEPAGRFLIKTDVAVAARLIAGQHGSAQLVRELIGRFLAQPSTALQAVRYLKLEKNELHVSAKFVEEAWPFYMNDRKPLPSAEVTRALVSMRSREGTRLSANGMRLNSHVLPEEMCGIGLELSGQGSADDVETAFKRVESTILAVIGNGKQQDKNQPSLRARVSGG